MLLLKGVVNHGFHHVFVRRQGLIEAQIASEGYGYHHEARRRTAWSVHVVVTPRYED